EKQGNVIGPLDMLIAAHALSRNLTLITNNEKEFKRIK
ncbi:MAG TPA: PIN domain-containing protein, partial [Desulfobulbaceae bacterium]|nr:PIN domain-containing protein [Desulfobulbaceae bacterium]